MPRLAPVGVPADDAVVLEPLVLPDVSPPPDAPSLEPPPSPAVFRTTVALPGPDESRRVTAAYRPVDRAGLLAELRAISTAPRCRAHAAIGCDRC